MASLDDKKIDLDHVEHYSTHGVPGLSKDQYMLAQANAIASTRSPWVVLKENKRVMATILSVQVQAIVLGIEYVLLGALVGNQAFCRTMGEYSAATDSYSIEAWKMSLWAGVFGIMQFLGQFVTGFLADRLGRRFALYMVIAITYVGVAVEIASTNYKVYTAAKVIMGAATGALQVVIPTYVAEVAPREIRGASVGLFAFNLSLGALIGNLVTYAGNTAFPDPMDNRGWRVPLYVGLATPTIVLVLQLFLLAESPYWLVLKNRGEDAKKSVLRLYPQYSVQEAEDNVALLVYTIEKEKESAAVAAGTSYLDCFRGPNLRRTFVAAFPSLVQQLAGNQLVNSYSTYFFTLAQISDALKASCVVSCLGLVGAIGAFFVVEKKVIGRFYLVFVGIATVTICMLGIGIVDSASGGVISQKGGYVLVFFVGLFNLAVSIGPGVAGWAYAGEAGSVRLRAKTTSLATGSNAIVGTFWNVVLPYELTAIGPKTGYMFFGIGVICTALTWFFIPDLTGRSFAEIDELFDRKIPARKFRTTECTGAYGQDEEDVHEGV